MKRTTCDNTNYEHQPYDAETIEQGNLTYLVLRCTKCDRIRGMRLIRKVIKFEHTT